MTTFERLLSGSRVVLGSVALLACFFWLGTLSRAAPERVTARLDVVTTLNDESVAEPLRIVNRDRPALLLVFSTSCPYCEVNMPQWSHLLEVAAAHPDVEVILLSKSSFLQTSEYLEAYGFTSATTKWIDADQLAAIEASGTPSTVFVPAASHEVLVWRGVLSNARLGRIARTLGRAGSGKGGPKGSQP